MFRFYCCVWQLQTLIMVHKQLLACYLFITVVRSNGLRPLNRYPIGRSYREVASATISADMNSSTTVIFDRPDLVVRHSIVHFIVKLDADTKANGGVGYSSKFVSPSTAAVIYHQVPSLFQDINWRNDDETISNNSDNFSVVYHESNPTVGLKPSNVASNYDMRLIKYVPYSVENTNQSASKNRFRRMTGESTEQQLRKLPNSDIVQRETETYDERLMRQRNVEDLGFAYVEPGAYDVLNNVKQLLVRKQGNLTAATNEVLRSRREVDAAITLSGVVAAASNAAAVTGAGRKHDYLRETLANIANGFALTRRNEKNIITVRKEKLWRQIINLHDFQEFDRYIEQLPVEKQKSVLLWLYAHYFEDMSDTAVADTVDDFHDELSDNDDTTANMKAVVERYFDEIEQGIDEDGRLKRRQVEYLRSFADSAFRRQTHFAVVAGDEFDRSERFQDDDYDDVDKDITKVERRWLVNDDRLHRRYFDPDEFGLIVVRETDDALTSVNKHQMESTTKSRRLVGTYFKKQPVSHSAVAEAILTSVYGGNRNRLVAASGQQQQQQQQSASEAQIVQFISLLTEQQLSFDMKRARDVNNSHDIEELLSVLQQQLLQQQR